MSLRIETIINSENTYSGINHDLIIIEQEWKDRIPTRKGTWYGKIKHMYLFDQGIIKECSQDTIKVFKIGHRYDWISDRAVEDKNKLYILFLQRKGNIIKIMFRNDIWYYSFGAKLVKDSNGKTHIVEIPASFLAHD